MSYCFMFDALEIDKDKEPDWEAAKKYIADLTEDQRQNILCEFDTRCLTSTAETLDDFKGEVEDVLVIIKGYWEHPTEYTAVVKTTMHYTTILISGFMSYGDTTEEMDEIAWFFASGLAKAAGFFA